MIPRTAYFKGQFPTDKELDALEREIDDQMYCGNDVLILIAEVRLLRELRKMSDREKEVIQAKLEELISFARAESSKAVGDPMKYAYLVGQIIGKIEVLAIEIATLANS